MKIRITLKHHIWLALVEGLISLVLLLLIPSDPKSIWALGFSKTRILLLISIALPIIFLLILAVKARKNKVWLKMGTQKITAIFQWHGHITTGFVLSLSGLIAGCYFLFTALTTTDIFIKGYFIRLTPWAFWITAIFGQILTFLVFHDKNIWKHYIQAHGKAVLTIFIVLIAGLWIHNYLWELQPETWDTHKMFNLDNKFDLYQQDIFSIF